jgi:hypothetical protein
MWTKHGSYRQAMLASFSWRVTRAEDVHAARMVSSADTSSVLRPYFGNVEDSGLIQSTTDVSLLS